MCISGGPDLLQCLYLEGNSLVDVPEHVLARFKSLKYLDLRNNRLKHLPRAVGGLKALKTLLLSGNQLQALPTELGEIMCMHTHSAATVPTGALAEMVTNCICVYICVCACVFVKCVHVYCCSLCTTQAPCPT